MIDENSMTPYENKVRRNLLTNAGRRIFLEAGDGLGTIVYTRATLSSQKLVDVNGNEFDNNTVRGINNLADDLKEGQIKLGTIADDHFDVIADFSNENQFSDISFNTIGWYARLDTVGSDGGTTEGKEVLMVITEMTDQPTTLPACSADGLSTQSISIELDMAISNAADIKMTAEKNDYVTHTELNVWKTKIIADIKAVSLDPNIDQIKENTTHIQNLEGAGQLTDILITDQAGNHITDSYGNRIGGYKWLPLTDVTLTQAGLPADGQAVGEAVGEAITDILDPHAERYDIPVLYLYSELIPSLKDKSITLENKVKYKFPKYGISGVLKKLKVQGRTSAGLPEKNYTLNFDKKTTIFSDFGYQNKYVIKANYTDFSQAKNVVSAKVWGAVRHQHDAFETIQTNAGDYLTDEAGNHIQGICDPQLSISKTAGAIDGFPIALYVNDKFAGLYTFNIPKDGWMAKMPNKDGYAMVSVDWSNLDHQVDTTNTSDFGDVEIEFCGTKDKSWVQKSFNDLITALNQDYTDQSHFDMAIDPLLDLDSAIDYYCYSVLIGNIDGINSNFIFQTFDKTKWYIAAYDLDKTYGTTTDFETVIRPNSDNQNADLQRGIKRYGITFENMAKNSKVFSQLWKHHEDDVLNRTKELISTVMSPEEIACTFYDFTKKIPLALYNADAKRWPQKPYTSLLNSNQISLWYSQRINFIKQKYLSDKGEK